MLMLLLLLHMLPLREAHALLLLLACKRSSIDIRRHAGGIWHDMHLRLLLLMWQDNLGAALGGSGGSRWA